MIQAVLHKIKQNKVLLLINALFFIIYSLICFVNHYNFRTYSLDLGVYTRAVYDYAHFNLSYTDVFTPEKESILADHFAPILIIISPLYYLFGTYVLLVTQILFIHIGALGIYKIAQLQTNNTTIANISVAAFLSFFGILSAVSFDVHTNVFAAMMVPWLFYFFLRSKWGYTLTVSVLILLCKENIVLWLIFIGFGLAWLNYKDSKKRNIALAISAFSALYFIVVTMFVMPALSVSGHFEQMKYGALGKSFPEILQTLIEHPIYSFSLLFINPTNNHVFNYYKIETHIFIFISGGFLLFFKPQYLLMLIPIYFQKMFHNTSIIWSVSMHYSVEFAPILLICFISVLSNIKSEKRKVAFALIYLVLCVGVTIRLCDNTIGFVDKTRIRFYQADHYESDFDTKTAYAAINQIPKNAVVSAENMFVPHLIDREMVYQYPIVKNSTYILLSDDPHSYPLPSDKVLKQIDSLRSSVNWKILATNDHIYLFEMIEKH
ncbi:MAG TPA: DUF2079 domain-containing protein [Bacteroidia bacterium]|nr:DUF2079 domain-containing protein [Bacteroidia bacterium]